MSVKSLFISLWILTMSQTTIQAADKVIIAHRGASGYLPEHTLEGVAMAHAFGADFIEQDVVLSKDNVPVVLHDIELEPVTDVALKFPDRKRADGKFYAIDFTLAELKSLNVHERMDLKTGKQAFPARFPINQGTFRIPTLEEELQLIQGLNKSRNKSIGIYPEIKSPAFHRREGRDISKIVVEILARYGYRTTSDNCIMQCFEWPELLEIRKLGYKGQLVFLIGSKVVLDDGKTAKLTPDTFRKIATIATGIGPALSLVIDKSNRPTDFVNKAHAAGLIVHPYTIRTDTATDSNWFKLVLDDAQADGVFTDQPDAGIRWKNSRN